MDGLLAEHYGWTPAEIDAVDRNRVLRWWAVKAVHDQAEQYLSQFMGRWQQTQATVEMLRGSKGEHQA